MKSFLTIHRALIILCVIFLFSTDTFAQAGAAGINEATNTIKAYFPLVKNLSLVLGGVIGLIGGIRIFIKWNNGEDGINKEILSWGGACLFLIIAPIVLSSFFGI